jgi:hypothetical protein
MEIRDKHPAVLLTSGGSAATTWLNENRRELRKVQCVLDGVPCDHTLSSSRQARHSMDSLA